MVGAIAEVSRTSPSPPVVVKAELRTAANSEELVRSSDDREPAVSAIDTADALTERICAQQRSSRHWVLGR